MSRRQANNGVENPPKLVPTGSVNKVLLVGGKNLTMFQSLGLLVFAVLSLGVGTAMLRIEGVWFAVWGIALSLWGVVMLFNGSKGAIREIRRRTSQSARRP